MNRFDCMKILAARLKDELVVLSLGASVDEWYNAAPHMRAASLFQQQLGCVTPQAFGLAVGLPHRRVISLDTDGGMMFNLGILATLGNEQPKNLLVVVDREEAVAHLSLRNLDGVHVLVPDQLNTYDVLCADDIVFTMAALDTFLTGPIATKVRVKAKGAKAE